MKKTHYPKASLRYFIPAMLLVSAAHAIVLVDEDFQGSPAPVVNAPRITNSDLFFYGTSGGTPSLLSSGGNTYLKTANGVTVGSGTVTDGDPVVYGSVSAIPSSVEFSVFFGINIPGTNSVGSNNGGAVGFGWTSSTATIANFNGGASNFTIGAYKISGNPADADPHYYYGLSWSNNTSTNDASSRAFQDQVGGVELSLGTWYCLHGQIDYDANTETFSFNLSLDDWGDGTTLVASGLLTGSDTATIAGFGDQGQPIYFANSSRGGSALDNFYAATVVPEPQVSALAFGFLIGLFTIIQNRRKKSF